MSDKGASAIANAIIVFGFMILLAVVFNKSPRQNFMHESRNIAEGLQGAACILVGGKYYGINTCSLPTE